jgi:hypothetical protein
MGKNTTEQQALVALVLRNFLYYYRVYWLSMHSRLVRYEKN